MPYATKFYGFSVPLCVDYISNGCLVFGKVPLTYDI